jgi:hypothetical protein
VVDLASLLRKYREIVRLRRESDADPGVDPRAAMAALAAEFPGALREADELPMAELLRRVRELEAALDSGAEPAPWMTAIARFHALTRGALSAKRWLAGRKEVDEALVGAFEEGTGALLHPVDARAWAGDLHLLADPPRGRLTEAVFAKLAVEVGRDVREVRLLVFSASRVGGGKGVD